MPLQAAVAVWGTAPRSTCEYSNLLIDPLPAPVTLLSEALA
jgi:hypothetical protein